MALVLTPVARSTKNLLTLSPEGVTNFADVKRDFADFAALKAAFATFGDLKAS